MKYVYIYSIKIEAAVITRVCVLIHKHTIITIVSTIWKYVKITTVTHARMHTHMHTGTFANVNTYNHIVRLHTVYKLYIPS